MANTGAATANTTFRSVLVGVVVVAGPRPEDVRELPPNSAEASPDAAVVMTRQTCDTYSVLDQTAGPISCKYVTSRQMLVMAAQRKIASNSQPDRRAHHSRSASSLMPVGALSNDRSLRLEIP